MKFISKSLLMTGMALLTVPSILLAQKEKESKDQKEQKEVQHIMITRRGNADEKMVIEVKGDKVKINGKDANEIKDIEVNVNTIKGDHFFRLTTPRGGNFNMNWDDQNGVSLFSEDEHRAMLGVLTEGNDKGAEIREVTEKSPAEKAGLKKGDIITRIGDKKIESTDELTDVVREHKPGEKVSITYLRDGKEQKTTAELDKWKGIKMNTISIPKLEGMNSWNQMGTPEPPMVMNNGNFVFSGRPKLGLSIQDTDDGVGVKVLDVDEESNAAKAGLKKDDVITGIDDQEIKSTDDVTRIIRTSRDKYSFTFKVKRDGKTQNIEVKYPKKLKTTDL